MKVTQEKSTRRDQTGFGAIDYGLMGFGSALALFATGQAVGAPECGQLFVGLIACGTLVSYGIRRLFSTSKLLRFDSVLYTIVSILAVVFAADLNSILPADGIPQDVTTAGWLCWMLTLGSFFAWRDRTLLFQAVPTIAMFGLIGCYDTYAPAPFLFFGFLLCLATLLGRSHSREMLRLAVMSGYFNRGESTMMVGEQPEQSPELYEAIKRGPWRWLAGPEWALLSGLVIVVFSLLGAPVIREAVQPISGAMRVLAPKRMRTAAANRAPDAATGYSVGRGPLIGQNTPRTPLYIVQFDRLRYLRTAIYSSYNGKTWTYSLTGRQGMPDPNDGEPVIARMSARRPFHIGLQVLTTSSTVPLPAEATTASPPSLIFKGGGSAEIESGAPDRSFEIFGIDSVEPPVSAKLVETGDDNDLDLQHWDSEHDPNLDKSRLLPAVRDFAVAAAKGRKTDYDRAVAVQTAIAARCKYYLGASAVPENRDAADYFLNDSKVGYCDLFATAMVECARAINIPAHFCLGYLADAKSTDTDGKTTIYDKDYHAWAELYFKDVGWVVFDATSGAVEINPDSSSGAASWLAGVFPIVVDVLIGITAAVVVCAGIWSTLQSRKKPSARSRTDVEKIYVRFAKRIYSFTRYRRGLGETADEYVKRMGPYLGGASAGAARLNQHLVSSLYGAESLDEKSMEALRTELRSFESLLKSQPRTVPPSPNSSP